MESTLNAPFENYSWGTHHIEFILLLSKKKERILVGTRYGILSRLRTSTYSAADAELSLQPNQLAENSSENWESIADKIHSTFDIIIESFISNPISALKKHRAIQENNAIDFIPIICDCSYEVGRFLKKFEYDPEENWKQAILLLQSALQSKNPMKQHKLEKAAKQILNAKWQSNDPVCQYASLRIWQEYLRKSNTFLPDMTMLTRVFSIPPGNPLDSGKSISLYDPILRLPNKILPDEERIQIWTPAHIDKTCAVLGNSFVPMKLYYRDVLNERGEKFHICSVCGDIFLTTTQKKKVCSDDCAKERTKKAKAKYDAKVREDDLETFVKQEYQFWYGRANKAREIPGFPPDHLAKIELAFETYKKESRIQKGLAKKSGNPLKTFQDWAFAQEHIIVELMGEYEGRPRSRKNTL